MRAAPLKGDCVICQAPEPIRIAVNAVIWPGEGTVRSANYRADAVRAAGQVAATIPNADRYRDLDPKTITRHAEHIEGSWRDVPPGSRLRDDEVPVATDFPSVTEDVTRLGQKVRAKLEEYIDGDGPITVKDAIALLKTGLVAVNAREAARLKGNQQAIDVMAIFAQSSGHVRAPVHRDEQAAADIETMKGELAAERLLLSERAGHVSRETPEPGIDDLPDDVAALL